MISHRPGTWKATEILAGACVAAALLGLYEWSAGPTPISAATISLGGLLAYWIAGRSPAILAAGMIGGLLVGSGLHLWVHYAEGRMNSAESTVGHFAVDAGLGALIAAVILSATVGVGRLLRRAIGKRAVLTDAEQS